jgi:hypothetical protein
MVRGQLPKAYLRIDPDLDAKHPDHLAEFIRLLCAANRQPRRGWFKTRAVIEGLLGKSVTKHLITRGDVIEDGTEWAVDGWDKWQEGNLDVAERMRRIRASRDNKPRTNGAQIAHIPRTEGAQMVAPTSEATRQQGVIDDDPQTPDEMELLTDDLLAPNVATPKQLRAFQNFSRAVGRARTIEVMRHWRGRLDADDRFTGAYEQLEAEALDAKSKRGKSSEFAYMDAESA